MVIYNKYRKDGHGMHSYTEKSDGVRKVYNFIGIILVYSI